MSSAARPYQQPWFYALTALVFAAWRLTAQGPWYDELCTLYRASNGFTDGIVESFKEFHLPVYPSLVWIFSLGGNTLIGARLESLLVFVAGAPLLFLVVRRLADTSHAIASASLYSFSPLLVWHAQDARHYAHLTFMCIASMVGLLRVLDGKKHASWLLAFCVGVGLLTHLYFVAFLGALGAHALIAWRTGTEDDRRHGKRALMVLCGVFAAVLPILIGFYLASRHGRSGFHKPLGITTLGYPALTFAVGYSFGPTVREMHLGAMAAMKPYLGQALAVIAVFWAPIAIGFVRIVRRSPRDAAILAGYLLLPLFIPFAIALVVSTGTFNVRYVLPAILGAFLLAGYAIGEGPKWARVASAIAIGGVQLLGLMLYYYDERHFKEDFEGAGAYVAERLLPEDVVAWAPVPYVFSTCLRLHGKGRRHVEILDADRVKSPNDEVRTFYVMTRPWAADPDGAIRRAIEADPHVVHHETFRGIEVWVREPLGDRSDQRAAE